MKTRLQRQQEKASLRQAGKYLFFTVIGLFLLIRFGLPGLIKLAGFLGELKSTDEPIETNAALPPQAPTLLPLPEATNSAQISIAGYAQAGASVRLNRGGLTVEETVADAAGNFIFHGIALKQGNNEFFAETISDQNQISAPSKTYIVTLDQIPPQLDLEQPEAGQRFFDRDSPIAVSGQTEAGSTLTLNQKFIRVDSDGYFSITWPLTAGDNQLNFVCRDAAGNESSANLSVNYTP